MDSSREDLPRVSVDSVQDWRRLESNYRHATLSRLEEQIVAQGRTSERDALIAHANHFVDLTLKAARPNLRINGQSYESLDQDGQNTELFDEALDRRIWSLADTRLQWHKRIAQARRTTPVDIERALLELFEQQRTLDAEETTNTLVDLPINGLGDSGNDSLPRLSQIEEGFQKIVSLVDELDQTIPRQLERAESVVQATTEVRALKL